MAKYEVTPLDEGKPPYSRKNHEAILGQLEDVRTEAEIIREAQKPKFDELDQLVEQTPDATPEELAAIEVERANIASSLKEKLKPTEDHITRKEAEHRQQLGKAQSEAISTNERGDAIEAFQQMHRLEEGMSAEVEKAGDTGAGRQARALVEDALDAEKKLEALTKRARLTTGDGVHAGKLGAQFMAAYEQARKWATQTFRQDRFGQ